MNERISHGARRKVSLVLGLIFAALVTWLLAHRLSTGVPPPPWEKSELPAVPAPAENGLDEVIFPRSNVRMTRPPDALNALVRPLEKDAPANRWSAIARERAHVAAFVTEPSVRTARAEELRRIDQSLAAPRFADACTSEHLNCQTMEVMNLARVAALIDLHHAFEGAWPEAITRAIRLSRAANDYAASAINLLGHMVAIEMARTATDHLRVLVAGLGHARETAAGGTDPSPDLVRALADIDAHVARLDHARLDPRRAVIGECLWVREQLQYFLDHPGNGALPAGPMAAFMIDRRRTIAASDAVFKELFAWVSKRGHEALPAPPPREHASGPMWWSWNPGGKVMLDTIHIGYASSIRRVEHAARELTRSREALQRELRFQMQPHDSMR